MMHSIKGPMGFQDIKTNGSLLLVTVKSVLLINRTFNPFAVSLIK